MGKKQGWQLGQGPYSGHDSKGGSSKSEVRDRIAEADNPGKGDSAWSEAFGDTKTKDK